MHIFIYVCLYISIHLYLHICMCYMYVTKAFVAPQSGLKPRCPSASCPRPRGGIRPCGGICPRGGSCPRGSSCLRGGIRSRSGSADLRHEHDQLRRCSHLVTNPLGALCTSGADRFGHLRPGVDVHGSAHEHPC